MLAGAGGRGAGAGPVAAAVTAPLFECEGLAEVLDLVSRRRLSVWLSAAVDDDGRADVLVDLVELVASGRHALGGAGDREDTDPFRSDGTTLHMRLRLAPHEARHLAAALTVAGFAADQRFS